MSVLVILGVLVLVLPSMLVGLFVCLLLYGIQIAMTTRLNREAKRAANAAMNPVQSTLAEIEQGEERHLM